MHFPDGLDDVIVIKIEEVTDEPKCGMVNRGRANAQY